MDARVRVGIEAIDPEGQVVLIRRERRAEIDAGTDFSLEQEKRKVQCPTCKSTRVAPQLGGFMAQTGKKS
jgi:hypothetical protein